jgi:hypothetical protein
MGVGLILIASQREDDPSFTTGTIVAWPVT